jgi:hypothetical protein
LIALPAFEGRSQPAGRLRLPELNRMMREFVAFARPNLSMSRSRAVVDAAAARKTTSRSRRSDEAGPSSASQRAALICFVVILLAALVLFYVHGRSQWFWLDEWVFLAGREATSLNDLFRPHVQHWSTLPILLYRALFNAFGVRTYLPYQLPVIVLHLVVAGLLRTIVRRLCVNPWIATATAGLFALFGAAHENIVWAFQVAWQMSLVFGFVHLILADHDGPLSKRDFWGLAVGTVALTSSGLAVTMTLVVGLAVLLRRGPRPALFHTLPLAAIYAIWFVAIGRQGYDGLDMSAVSTASFAARGYMATFDALGQIPFYGWVIGGILVFGLVIAWYPLPIASLRKQAAIPIAGLVGAIAFYILNGLGRGNRVLYGSYGAGRYMNVAVALTLPALAVAADAIVRRWRAALPLIVVALLVGIPGNIDDLANRDKGLGVLRLGGKDVLAMAHVPALYEVSSDVRPWLESDDVTVGWLRSNARAGRIPRPDQLTPRAVDGASLRLFLTAELRLTSGERCPALGRGESRNLDTDDQIVLQRGVLTIRYRNAARTIAAWQELALTAHRDGLPLEIVPADPQHPPAVCFRSTPTPNVTPSTTRPN